MAGSSKLSDYDYDWEYRETVPLEDGTEIEVRLVRPDDRELLRRGFQQLSAESRYRRFLGPKSRLSERELEYLVEIDQVDHVAIGARVPAAGEDDAERGVALARCVRLEQEPHAAEAAVTVVDEFQARGLGRTLLDRLVGAARERGVETFRATLFAQNKPMQALLREIGDARIIERDGPVVTLGISLGDAEAAAGAGEESKEPSTLQRILSLTGRGAATLVDKFTTDDGDNLPGRSESTGDR
jgi:GNAT superfamily N-acetyltransferase